MALSEGDWNGLFFFGWGWIKAWLHEKATPEHVTTGPFCDHAPNIDPECLLHPCVRVGCTFSGCEHVIRNARKSFHRSEAPDLSGDDLVIFCEISASC